MRSRSEIDAGGSQPFVGRKSGDQARRNGRLERIIILVQNKILVNVFNHV